MIKVTRLNSAELVLNSRLIKYLESRPDTIITLVNDEKLVVRESLDDVVRRVIEYERRLRVFDD